MVLDWGLRNDVIAAKKCDKDQHPQELSLGGSSGGFFFLSFSPLWPQLISIQQAPQVPGLLIILVR